MDRITVLFVDDDRFIREAYGELLRDEGFEVVEASNGGEALEAATAIHGDVLLVLDEEMPRLTGTQVVELLDRRDDAARFRVVIISGSCNSEGNVRPRRGVRVQAVVPKPFTADELLSTLHRLAA
jgi:CheY-like chemotaxis protein